MRRSLRAAVAVAAAGTFGAPPAIAADEQVRVAETAFTPAAVAITPGDTVTWNYLGDSEEHHNVRFEDEQYTFPQSGAVVLTPWTATRTFTTAAAYRYYCEHHGGPGGQGMSGIVYVNAGAQLPGAPPTASLTASTELATVGQDVTFSAVGSADPDPGGSVIRYEWDLDGNGTFETDRGTQPTSSWEYATPGQRTVGLRVTDSDMRSAVATRVVTVTNVPIAAFSASPNPVQAGRAVSFDASASSDPDGTIAKYEWDLDGNGSYELDTGTTATAGRSYAAPGTLTVGLRVTDNHGVTATATQALQVSAPPPPVVPPPPPPPAAPAEVAPPPPPPPAPAAASCSTLNGVQRATCMQRRCRTLKGTRRATCIQASCRYVARSRRASCVRTSCRYVAKGKRASCLRASCRYVTGAKARACLRTYPARKRA